VVPSIWEENGPLAILEAQAEGAALIVADRGGLPEFVRHEESGLVAAAGDVAALAAAIRRLAGDADLARRLGERGRADVRAEHSADRHYERLMAVYATAMAEV
jgi:glycosyltransferase involved in cell wall biosynthesis